MTIRQTALSAGAALLLAACTSTPPMAAARIDAARMNEHVRILAGDDMEGRGPTSPGEARAIAYIAAEFEKLGLEPAGPAGSWYQPVPIRRFLQDGPATITASAPGWSLPMERATDIIVGSHRLDARVMLKDAPIVFVGFGVSAPERDWDDFKGVDLHGSVMLVLVNDPDFEVPEDSPIAGRFDGRGMTYYGRWTYKFEEAARRGAAAVVVIHEREGAGYPWSTLQNSSTAAGFDIVRADVNAERVAVQGWVQLSVAQAILKQAGLDFATLKAAAQRPDFQPVTLGAVRFSVDFAQKTDLLETHNVLARITGSERPNETVLYGAHWDAHGRATPNAAGDDIYNGAVDNASGVAGLLELARATAAGPRSKRTVMFASWAAEESGLLGAAYYAANPVVPLETTVANLNMDALLPGPAEPDIVVIGYGKTDVQDMLAEAARATGRRLIPDPAPQVGAFYRSDHFPLALRGVPSLFAAAGFTGATEASRAYVRDRYHQPTDAWDESWTMEGAAADVQLVFEVGQRLANGQDWPRWSEGNEFEAVRLKSEETRR